jgi:choline dehydrogenase-like flavoprotein
MTRQHLIQPGPLARPVRTTPARADPPPRAADIVIVGSGMGGSTLAYALRDRGARVVVLERGDVLPQEPQNWDPQAVFWDTRYKPAEEWHAGDGTAYQPGVYYWVGGNTKMFGAALTRFRAEDFGELVHRGGVSPAWPLTYDEIEPYYGAAEDLYRVHGDLTGDPTEPPHSRPYPYPPLPHEPVMAALAQRLREQGLHPFSLPMGIDYRPGGACIWCQTCDGFPCRVHAKSDAEVCALRPALATGNVHLSTRTRVLRLRTDPTGRRVVVADVERDGERFDVTGDAFVLAAGAANTAAILLRSADGPHPRGLANNADTVGRYYMQHNMSAIMAIAPFKINDTVFQKTLAVNDVYLAGAHVHYPLGSLATFGKVTGPILKAMRPHLPLRVLHELARRSTDWWLLSEDLPRRDNRVVLDAHGGIVVHRQLTNYAAHRQLIRFTRRMLQRAGYPLVLHQEFGLETTSHHCGTARMGADPATSVVDPTGKAHDLDNLYVADSSVFPASGANNPSLTIAALSLRLADQHFAPRRAQSTAHRSEV